MSMTALVGSGSFDIEQESDEIKYAHCLTAGEFSFPQNKCYGQWEFEVYKKDASLVRVCFANDLDTLTGANGMMLQFTNTERAAAATVIAGVFANPMYSAENIVPVDAWAKYKVTRTLDNEYSFYMDGELVVNVMGGGSNPFTSAIPSESKFCVVHLEAGDRIRNFRHSLGVIQ